MAHRAVSDLAEITVPLDITTGEGFDAIAAASKRARVVLLGEATHGDGATFRYKSEVVRQLHLAGEIDAMTWEAGSYDCWLVDRAFERGVAPMTALAAGVHGIWLAEQTRALADYVAETFATDRPLRQLGFDTQYSGIVTVDTVAGDISALAHNSISDTEATAIRDIARRSLVFREQMDEPSYRIARSVVEAVRQRERAQDPNSLASRFLGDLLDNDDVQPALNEWVNSQRQPDGTWVMNESDPFYKERFGRRDQAMADNVVWQLSQHPNVRMAGWLANGHALRNVATINAGTDPRFQSFVTMGDVLSDRLGEECYVLLATSYSGRLVGTSGAPEPLPPSAPESLESALHDLGHASCFVDLHRLPPDSAWRDPVLWRCWGPEQNRAAPPDLADGLLFIDEQEPAVAAPESHRPVPAAGP